MFVLATTYIFLWGWRGSRHYSCVAIFVFPAILFIFFEALIQAALGEFNFARIFIQIGFSWFVLFLVLFFGDHRFDSRLLFKFFCFSGFLLSLVVISQYFNFMGFNNLYYPLIGSDRAVSYLNMEYNRVIGLYGNPNEVGFVFGLMIFAVVLAFDRFKIRFFYILFFALAVLLSQSRTVWLALAVSLLVFLVLERSSLKRSLFLTFLSLISFFILSYFFDFSEFYDRALDFNSLILRVDNLWAPTMEKINQSPFFPGPARESISAVDNEFLSVWVRYGIFPLLALLFWFFIIFLCSLRFGRVSEAKRILFSLMLYVFIYSLAVDTFMFRFKITSIVPLMIIIYAYHCTEKRRRWEDRQCKSLV